MKKTRFLLFLGITIISILSVQNVSAQAASTERPIRTLTGHTGSVISVAFSPDGNTIRSGSSDKTIKLWETSTGKLKRTINTEHSGFVTCFASNPVGDTFASGSWDGTIKVWNTRTGKLLQTLAMLNPARRPIEEWVYSLTFSPDGNTIASGSLNRNFSSNAIRIWSAHIVGGYPRTLTGHTGPVMSVAFSHDGHTIVSGSSDKTIKLWETSTGKLKRTISRHTDLVQRVAFSPDGQTFASGSWDSTIMLWETSTGNRIRTLTHIDQVHSVAFSPDGHTIVGGSDDGTIMLWETSTGNRIRTLTGPIGWRVTSLAFRPDGHMLASASASGIVLLWEVAPEPTTNATVVHLTPATIVSPNKGEQLTFLLNINNGEYVTGYQATLQFDMTALKYVESQNSNYLPVGAFAIPAKADGNTVTLAAIALADESHDDGTLATITFEVVAPKASTITLSDVLLTNSDRETSIPQTENAQITAQTHRPEDVNSDGVVNILDLMLVAAKLGQTGKNTEDVNSDGVVNIADLILVAAAFGNTASAPFVWGRDLEIAPTKTDIERWLQQARQLNFTEHAFQRGILLLEQLLAALTPKETELLPNYPNPFNPETWIPFQLATPAEVTLTIYSAKGTVVKTLQLGNMPAGHYTSRSRAAYWDGKNSLNEKVASGVYFYTLTADDFSQTRKMLVIK